MMRPRTVFDVDEAKVRRVPVWPTSACGKTLFTSRKVAAEAAARARRERGENVRPYKCGPCHGHHIGHPPGEARTLTEGASDGAEEDVVEVAGGRAGRGTGSEVDDRRAVGVAPEAA